MTADQSQTAITLSALVTTGMFAYRKVTEPEVKEATQAEPGFVQDYQSIFGAGPPIGWGQFLKGAGSLFIVLAIMGAASPDLGGGFAVLIGTSAALGNAIAVRRDLQAGGQEQIAKSEAVTQYHSVPLSTSGHVLRRR
jgi:hypothetical protein